MKKTYWFWVWIVVMTAQKERWKSRNPKGEVWRNLVLVSGSDAAEAVTKAMELGSQENDDSRGTLRLDGKPARAEFVGIEDMGLVHDGLGDGREILFSSNREFLKTTKKRITAEARLLARLQKEISPYVALEKKTKRSRKDSFSCYQSDASAIPPHGFPFRDNNHSETLI
jgi:hypothetical protein